MEILKGIALYVFILSIVFLLKYVIQFVMGLMSSSPQKIVIPKLERIGIMLAISYFLTYIIY